MDERKILLVKLSAQLDQVTSLVGTLFIALFLNAAYSRASLPVNKRKQFNLYADEFQRFATEDFATLLTEARKFGIATTIAHQARYQPGMTDGIRAVSLQAANYVVFRVTSPDADELAGGFDITPQAAWEEEIEKEWVEVLKSEWYERREEDVVDGTEPILTPRSDAIDWLLAGRTHGHPTVNTFISKWNIGEIDQDRQGKGKHPRLQTEATQFLNDLNKLSFQAMVYKNPDNLSITSEFIRVLLSLLEKVWYYEFFYTVVPENVQQQMKLFSLINMLHTSQWGTMIDQDYYKKTILRRLEMVVAGAENSKQPFMTTLTGYFHAYVPHIDTAWLINLNLNYLQWELREEITSQWTYSESGQGYSKEIKTMHTRLVKGQETSWYTPYSLEREIDRLMASPKEVSPRLTIVSFLSDLLAMLCILTIDEFEIRDKSGLERPRTRKQINILTHPRETLTHPRKVIMHPQRTYQDVQKDIANQLSGLQNFTARVKLSEILSHNPGKKCLSCKLLNNPGAKYCAGCGKQLPAPNEYTFTTLKPLGGLGKAALQQRLTTIQANNIQKGYVRDRSKVEAEILNRQIACSGGSAPAQPQHPTPQPRHARQVPVQGKCQNCGASNSPGAKFCNQCGTKL